MSVLVTYSGDGHREVIKVRCLEDAERLVRIFTRMGHSAIVVYSVSE